MSKKHRARKSRAPQIAPQLTAPVTDAKPRGISWSALAASAVNPKKAQTTQFSLPEPPPGVVPANAPTMAMDYDLTGGLDYVNNGSMLGVHWMGYAALAEAAQIPEVRRLSEVIAREVTRKFIKLQSSGDEDKSDKIKLLEAAFDRYRVREVFREVALMDNLFGRAHLYLDLGTTDDEAELLTPLLLSPNKIKKGALKRLQVVEPFWTYAQDYGTRSPLKPDFYEPQSWFVMGQKLHRSRLLTFVGRPVPQILRAAFAFGGLSLTQMALPVIEGWREIRKSVVSLVKSYSVSGIKTNLQATLMGAGGEDMINRAQLFNQTRDNRNLMILDRESEEYFNVSTPLGTIDHLQAQSQEHIAAIGGTPVSILNGLTPSGLNASSEGEIRIWYAWCESYREQLFRPHLETVLKVMQLSVLGSIDPEIGFRFEQLWEMNATEQAVVRKTDVDTAVELINAGVLHPEEERQRLASSEDSLYHGLNVADVPDPPQDPQDPSLLSDPAKGEEHEAEDARISFDEV